MGKRETGCTERQSRCRKGGKCKRSTENKPGKSEGHWQLNSRLMQQLSADDTKNSPQVIDD